jgi:hypothetical protein
LPVYSSSPLNSTISGIVGALIIIHGLSADADGYFSAAVAAALGRENILIVAPFFGPTLLTGNNWEVGGNINDFSLNFNSSSCWMSGCSGRGPPTNIKWYSSSFDAMDQLISRLSNRSYYPKLESLVSIAFASVLKCDI